MLRNLFFYVAGGTCNRNSVRNYCAAHIIWNHDRETGEGDWQAAPNPEGYRLCGAACVGVRVLSGDSGILSSRRRRHVCGIL